MAEGIFEPGLDCIYVPSAAAWWRSCLRLMADLAQRIGVSKPTVWAWKHGRARPREARLKEIAEALGTTIEDLDGLPGTDDLAFLMAQYRKQIATHFHVAPEKVKFVIAF